MVVLFTDLLLTNRQILFSIKSTSVRYLAFFSVKLDYQLYCKLLRNINEEARWLLGWEDE